MKRLGALVVAAALIAGAILVNRAIHDDDSPSGSDAQATKLRVTCATEFAAACKTLDATADVTIEAPGTTVAALVADPTPTFDLWITSEPWPELARLRSEVAGHPAPGIDEPSEPLASEVLSVVARTGGADLVAGTCRTPFSTTCLLQAPPTLGTRPTTETAGLLAVGSFIETWPGLEDPDVTSIDIDDAFRTAFATLKRSTKSDPNPVRTLLTVPKFAFAIDLGAPQELRGAANRDRFTALSTDVTAVAVAVPAATAAGSDALGRLGRGKLVDALTAAGWSAKIPDDDGLPDPAVLDYLVSKWNNQ